MQKLPFTRKSLTDWAGAQVVHDAEIIVKQGHVLRADYEPPWISGAILLNNREFPTRLRLLDNGHVENACPCYANRERGIICTHVIALGLKLIMRATDPAREIRYKEERRRASRIANLDESAYLKRAAAGSPGSRPARLVVSLATEWEQALENGPIPLSIRIAIGNQTLTPQDVPETLSLGLDRFDTSLLYVLEDIAEGPITDSLNVSIRDFINILNLHKNRILPLDDDTSISVHASTVSTRLRMHIAPESGELILASHTTCPGLDAADEPRIVVAGGTAWALACAQAWPLDKVLPEPYHAVYSGPVPIARQDVIRFLHHELPLLERFANVETDIAADLFSVDPAIPRFRLQLVGSPASLAGTLYAEYGELSLIAGRPDAQEHFAIPDPEDAMRYTIRNREAEAAALTLLADCGMRGETGNNLTPVVGEREVLNMLGAAVPRLRRHGWKVDLEGRVAPYFETMDFVTPVVKVETESGASWFEVGFDYEEISGASVSAIDVQRAIRRGDAWLESGGRRMLIDVTAVEAMLDVFNDCAAGEAARAGRFRLDNVYGPFVKGSLEGLDGIDIEDNPLWREQAARMNRSAHMEAVTLPEPLTSILRPYQKEGVNWLRFMEQQGFGGILADEMGLGKTLQTLVWLQLERCRPASRGQPALIVCPTSLVENWAEEAARFTPDLRVLVISGTGEERNTLLDRIGQCDLAITSYALLRRDLDRLLETEFSAAILDEAQHIKNRSTQNARAAKQIRASQRFVLTGTPVENSVADLWSIMDFLMPGYLGRHDDFRTRYELPIGRGNEEGAEAQRRLRRKLHPFLLRRLKRDVARDLPPKIERTTFCTLSPDQRVVYQGLLQQSRDRITGLVSQRGFAGARMEILTVLLRLRQACCHLDLLKLPDLKATEPSAKLDLFLELVDEAVDGGHRILVFSQFTSMLGILRNTLAAHEIDCCYLDGSTKNRMNEVHRFNTSREIPVFLISLKAGGTGLNLTGADMVIHYDPWWNPAVENQATDRAYRIGQKRTVYSNKLITRGTVEEKVLQMQARKQAVIDATVESDEAIMRSLNWDDVQELLDL